MTQEFGVQRDRQTYDSIYDSLRTEPHRQRSGSASHYVLAPKEYSEQR